MRGGSLRVRRQNGISLMKLLPHWDWRKWHVVRRNQQPGEWKRSHQFVQGACIWWGIFSSWLIVREPAKCQPIEHRPTTTTIETSRGRSRKVVAPSLTELEPNTVHSLQAKRLAEVQPTSERRRANQLAGRPHILRDEFYAGCLAGAKSAAVIVARSNNYWRRVCQTVSRLGRQNFRCGFFSR